MKLLFLLALASIGQGALLGTKKCTYGPSYWCSNLRHAKECNTLQHCMAKVWKNQHLALIGSTENCFDVIKILDGVRQSGSAKVLERMAKGCTQMPAEKRSLCKELMTNDQNEVLLMLQSDLSSMNIAAAFGLCGGFSDAFPRLPVENGHVQLFQKEKVVPLSGDYCTDCLNFFGDVQEIVNNTEEMLAEKVKGLICTKLGPLESYCNKSVDCYANFVISFFVQQLNPHDVCFVLHMCDSETPTKFTNIRSIIAKMQLNGVECELCHSLAKDLQNFLKNTSLQNAVIKAVVNDMCTLLPGDLSAQCQSFVTEYGYLVFQVLVAELDPETFCETIGFCNGTKTDKLTVVSLDKQVSTVHVLAPEHKKRVNFGPTCPLCKEVVEKLESMVVTNATKEEISAALKKVCSLLPEWKTECDVFVDIYGSEVEKWLEKMAPEALCTLLGLCAGDKSHVESHVPVKSNEVCLICETVFGYFRSFINNPDNEKTIEAVMDEACGIVPASYKALCDEMVQKYTPVLIEELKKYDDPLSVCSKLHLCNSTKTSSKQSSQPAHPLRVEPMIELQPAMPRLLCAQGPKTWCANKENAKLCNAVEYCVKNYKLTMED